MLYKYLKPLIFKLPPELAHDAAHRLLGSGVFPAARIEKSSALEQELFGKTLRNPIGMAAGFDKNAKLVSPLFAQGFGAVEVGTVTPKPQDGNPKPRMFRLERDEAIINRLGFNNDGVEPFIENLLIGRALQPVNTLLGANIGKNKTSDDPIADYTALLQAVYGKADYVTVNISSPNTPGLRDLQGKDALDDLLGALMRLRGELQKASGLSMPLLVKIAPDMSDEQAQDMVDCAIAHKVDGMIVSNTTISRDGLVHDPGEDGGLSGKPLFERSTEMLRVVHQQSKGKMVLVGVGGVDSAQAAYAKIKAGASVVQLYSGLVYHGFRLVKQVCEELPGLLERDGFGSVHDAIGRH